jgi:hypothetical protein
MGLLFSGEFSVDWLAQACRYSRLAPAAWFSTYQPSTDSPNFRALGYNLHLASWFKRFLPDIRLTLPA